MEKLKLVRGNDYSLYVPVRCIILGKDSYGREMRTPVSVSLDECSIINVRIMDACDEGIKAPFDIRERVLPNSEVSSELKVGIGAFLECGWYGIEVTYVLNGRRYRSYERKVFKIVENNAKSFISPEMYAGENSYIIDTMWTLYGQDENVVFMPEYGVGTQGLGNTILVPESRKILVAGASFASAANGWDKLVQDETCVEVINRAFGGEHIYDMAAKMLDAYNADGSQKDGNMAHGSLFCVNNTDVFNAIGAVIIFYSHDVDVLLKEELYKTRSVDWYKEHPTEATGEKNSAGAWDYVIKQLKEWSQANTVQTDVYGKEINKVKNQIEIMICSHWLPSRSTYNETSRKLAIRHNVAYCPLDTELGFTDRDIIKGTENISTSVLHSQFTNTTEGKTEEIDGIVWGWHPQEVSPTTNYGFGTMYMRNASNPGYNGDLVYVPWIQRAIASVIRKSIANSVIVGGEGRFSIERKGVDSQANGEYSVAIGKGVRANGLGSHAEGWGTKANGKMSHTEGAETVADGQMSHAEGYGTHANKTAGHSEGFFCTADGNYSHAGGQRSEATGDASFVSGVYLQAKNRGEAAFGYFNESKKYEQEGDEASTIMSVGNGSVENVNGEQVITRKNAFEVKANGDIYITIRRNGVEERVLLQSLLLQLQADDTYTGGGPSNAPSVDPGNGDAQQVVVTIETPKWYVGQVTRTASQFAAMTANELRANAESHDVTEKDAEFVINKSCWYVMVPEGEDIKSARYTIEGFASVFSESEIKNGFESGVTHEDVEITGTTYKVYVNRNTALIDSEAIGKFTLK